MHTYAYPIGPTYALYNVAMFYRFDSHIRVLFLRTDTHMCA